MTDLVPEKFSGVKLCVDERICCLVVMDHGLISIRLGFQTYRQVQAAILPRGYEARSCLMKSRYDSGYCITQSRGPTRERQ